MLCAALAALACVAARADEATGKRLFAIGVERLRASDFAAAADAFAQSNAAWPRAAASCNLALTYDRWGGHDAEAADAYGRCAASDATGRLRDYALQRAAALRAQADAAAGAPPGNPDAPATTTHDASTAAPADAALSRTAAAATPSSATAEAKRGAATRPDPSRTSGAAPSDVSSASGAPAPGVVGSATSRVPSAPVASTEQHRGRRPIYKTWWLWTATAAVAVTAGVVLAVELASDRGAPSTSLGVFGPKAIEVRF